jgi:hypothetical protein
MNNNIDNIENPYITPPSTPKNGKNSQQNNKSEIKEEIVNINALKANENNNININNSLNSLSQNNRSNINNVEENNSSKKFNLNSQNAEENNFPKQFNLSSLDDNNDNNISSEPTKKITKTAITFNLDKKEKLVKENENADDDKNEDDNKKVSAYCPVCKAKASYMCSSCGPVIFYCSQSCQIAHWPEHRLVCKGAKKNKGKPIIEHKKTESIFGEIIDPTIGSNLVVGTRNVAQLINLKRSRTENSISKIASVLSNRKSTSNSKDDDEEEDEEDEDDNEGDDDDDEKEKNKKKNEFGMETTSKANIQTDDDNSKINLLIDIKTDNKYLDNKGKGKNNDNEDNDNIVNSFSTSNNFIQTKNEENFSETKNSSSLHHKNKNKNKNGGTKKTKRSRRKSVTAFINKATEDEEFIEDLKFYIQQIFLIIKPVLLCIILTILWVKLTDSNNAKVSVKQYIINRKSMGANENSDDTSQSTLGEVLMLLLKIILTTIIIVILFIFSCMKTLTGIFVAMVSLLLSFISLYLFYNIIRIYDIPIDTITIGIITWNIAVVGVVVIFWKGPLSVQQYYLVYISSIMAYSLTNIMTSYVTWLFLAALSIWDLIAVLTPFGPLRLLLKYSEENNQEIPALLYNLMVTLMATPPSITIKAKKDKENEDNDQEDLSEFMNNQKISLEVESQELENNSFAEDILNILDMKIVNSPPSSPKQSNLIISPLNHSNTSLSSSKQINITPSSPKQSSLVYPSSIQNRTSRSVSISSVSSGTLTRKKNPTLKKYPSNSSISVNGGRHVSRHYSGYRPPLSQTGSISDENASTANIFQDINNSNVSYSSLKRSNSRASSITFLSSDSQLTKKKIFNKMYLYSSGDKYKSSDGRRLTLSRPPSEIRINRSLSLVNSNTRSSRNYSYSNINDVESSFMSDDNSYITQTNTSFSSVIPLMHQRKSQINNSYSYSSESHSHSHNHNHNHNHHHNHHHNHNYHHHHNDRSTVSSPSAVHYHSTHKHKSHSTLGPSSDIFTTIEDLGIYKKSRKSKKSKKNIDKRRKREKEKLAKQKKEDQEEEAESTGIKLGLGDFVFYSVLVARAAMDGKDWLVTINCTVAVITGLTITIFLLAVLKKALPALPISIAFGLAIYCISKFFITKFVNNGIIFIYQFDITRDIYSIYKKIFTNYINFDSGLSIGKYYGGFTYF